MIFSRRSKPDQKPGLLLNRYQIEGVIGSGSMGEVLKVFDTQSEKFYALKRLPSEISTPSQLKSVKENFKLVSGLTHPHIAVTRFLEQDPLTNSVYLLIDLVQGCSLADWIYQRRQLVNDPSEAISWREALGIGEQIASALDYAHDQPTRFAENGAIEKRGILHRDIKPENVMVSQINEMSLGIPFVTLIDFGIATEIQGSMVGRTMMSAGSNEFAGTPVYMAPEQWEGRTLTRAVDQWALAVLIYEMIEGRPPFFGVNIQDLRHQILSSAPIAKERMSNEQWQALGRSLTRDRTQRYPTCLELISRLKSSAATHLQQDAQAANNRTVVAPVITGETYIAEDGDRSGAPEGYRSLGDQTSSDTTPKSSTLHPAAFVATERDSRSISDTVKKSGTNIPATLGTKQRVKAIALVLLLLVISLSLALVSQIAWNKSSNLSSAVAKPSSTSEQESLSDKSKAQTSSDSLHQTHDPETNIADVKTDVDQTPSEKTAGTDTQSEEIKTPGASNTISGSSPPQQAIVEADAKTIVDARTEEPTGSDNQSKEIKIPDASNVVSGQSPPQPAIVEDDAKTIVDQSRTEEPTGTDKRLDEIKISDATNAVSSQSPPQPAIVEADAKAILDQARSEEPADVGIQSKELKTPDASNTGSGQSPPQQAKIELKAPAIAPSANSSIQSKEIKTPEPVDTSSVPPQAQQAKVELSSLKNQSDPEPKINDPKTENAEYDDQAQNVTNSLGMNLVRIPAGEFVMGLTRKEYAARVTKDKKYLKPLYDEQPEHDVRISKDFYLGATEVTRGQFAKFVEATGYQTEAERNGLGGRGFNEKYVLEQKTEYTWRNGGFAQTDSHPVINVTWDDAVAFCNWLSQKEGKFYRLPSEAQWEYACRGGAKKFTRYWMGDNKESLALVGNVADGMAKEHFPDWETIRAKDGHIFTAPVAQYRANGYGLYDMHGNVFEWCNDLWAEDYYRMSPKVDPTGPSSGPGRIYRGGSFGQTYEACECTSRVGAASGSLGSSIGFRVCMAASDKHKSDK